MHNSFSQSLNVVFYKTKFNITKPDMHQ